MRADERINPFLCAGVGQGAVARYDQPVDVGGAGERDRDVELLVPAAAAVRVPARDLIGAARFDDPVLVVGRERAADGAGNVGREGLRGHERAA
jgi:hypothetical protein